jgi:hypothetical protein
MATTTTATGAELTAAGKTGASAAAALLKQFDSGACVDEHLQDQLIVFMALANGKSRVRTGELTLHTKTAIHYCALFTGVRYSVTADNDAADDDGIGGVSVGVGGGVGGVVGGGVAGVHVPVTYVIECDGMAYKRPESGESRKRMRE